VGDYSKGIGPLLGATPTGKEPLIDWYERTKRATWKRFADVKATFGQTDYAVVRSRRPVAIFDIGGNKYRVIAAIHYNTGRVFVLRVLTHKEYSTNAGSAMRRALRKTSAAELDSYFKLVRRFPLRRIRNEAEYDAAVEVMNALVMRGEDALDAGERDYLEALATFVSQYDDVHYKIP
jgi:mRNA interferase HigB